MSCVPVCRSCVNEWVWECVSKFVSKPSISGMWGCADACWRIIDMFLTRQWRCQKCVCTSVSKLLLCLRVANMGLWAALLNQSDTLRKTLIGFWHFWQVWIGFAGINFDHIASSVSKLCQNKNVSANLVPQSVSKPCQKTAWYVSKPCQTVLVNFSNSWKKCMLVHVVSRVSKLCQRLCVKVCVKSLCQTLCQKRWQILSKRAMYGSCECFDTYLQNFDSRLTQQLRWQKKPYEQMCQSCV